MAAKRENCDVCEGHTETPIHLEYGGRRHTFDCLQCAIQAIAPPCSHCGAKIIGHGLEAGGKFFCCAACQQHVGKGRPAGAEVPAPH